MKKLVTHLFIAGSMLFGCNSSINHQSSTADKTGGPDMNNATTESIMNEPSNEDKQGDGIVGKWNLIREAYDKNHNKILDAEERNKGFANKYFYQFNRDGTCLIHTMKFKGHYKIAEEKGKKKLTTYWDEAEQKGQTEAKYTIISVNKDELVLLEGIGDHTFWVFKRV